MYVFYTFLLSILIYCIHFLFIKSSPVWIFFWSLDFRSFPKVSDTCHRTSSIVSATLLPYAFLIKGAFNHFPVPGLKNLNSVLRACLSFYYVFLICFGGPWLISGLWLATQDVQRVSVDSKQSLAFNTHIIKLESCDIRNVAQYIRNMSFRRNLFFYLFWTLLRLLLNFVCLVYTKN